MRSRAADAYLPHRVNGRDEQGSALYREIPVPCTVAPGGGITRHVVDDILACFLVDLLHQRVCERVGDERLHRIGNVQLFQVPVSRGGQRGAYHSRLVAAAQVLGDVVPLELEIAVGEEYLPAAALDIEHAPYELRAGFFKELLLALVDDGAYPFVRRVGVAQVAERFVTVYPCNFTCHSVSPFLCFQLFFLQHRDCSSCRGGFRQRRVRPGRLSGLPRKRYRRRALPRGCRRSGLSSW